MRNKIIYINQKDMTEVIRNTYLHDNTFCIEINGKECRYLSDYLRDISNKLHFPIIAKGFDGYDDWMTDLSWIDKDNIVIIINNFADFLKYDLVCKKRVIELFEQSILTWWETEICDYVVGGKAKTFLVYLVD